MKAAKKRTHRSSTYNRYMRKRMNKLIAQGMSSGEAMRHAVAEYRERHSKARSRRSKRLRGTGKRRHASRAVSRRARRKANREAFRKRKNSGSSSIAAVTTLARLATEKHMSAKGLEALLRKAGARRYHGATARAKIDAALRSGANTRRIKALLAKTPVRRRAPSASSSGRREPLFESWGKGMGSYDPHADDDEEDDRPGALARLFGRDKSRRRKGRKGRKAARRADRRTMTRREKRAENRRKFREAKKRRRSSTRRWSSSKRRSKKGARRGRRR